VLTSVEKFTFEDGESFGVDSVISVGYYDYHHPKILYKYAGEKAKGFIGDEQTGLNEILKFHLFAYPPAIPGLSGAPAFKFPIGSTGSALKIVGMIIGGNAESTVMLRASVLIKAINEL
jgi:hypothetical protein